MTYKFDFGTLPFRAVISERVERAESKRVEPVADPVVEDQLHTHAYVRRRADEVPENCTAIYHTVDGDWLELDVGPESLVGQRTFPAVKILGIERVRG
jgi:hypothetical protein